MQDFSIRALSGSCVKFITSSVVRVGRFVRRTFVSLSPSEKIHLAVEQTVAQMQRSIVMFEGLENRQLFAGFSLSGGVLTITGNSSGSNKLGVNYNSSGQLAAELNSTIKTYSASSVSSIKLVGGSSADYMYITSATTRPGTFNAGGGNDTVWAGSGNDTICGEGGDDDLRGRGGNDVIYGGDGSDKIDGGSGSNSISYGNPTSSGSGSTPQAPAGATITDPSKPYPPVSPSNLVVSSASSTSLKLTWSDNTNRELGYKIERSTDGSSYAQVATAGANVSTYTDSGLTSGKRYYYRVRAYNEYGNSSYTNSASATTGSSSSGTGGSTGGIVPHDSSASPPNAVLTALTRTAVEGTSISVQATGSSLGSGTPITARYEWDFGDPNGKYNKLTGFNAAHLYDNPGSYTIKLTVINESGKSSTASTSVTISANNRKVLYVSTAGSDSNSGSSSSPLKTFARAAQVVGDNSNFEIRFRRGDTFNVTSTMSLGGDNIVVGDYGSGSLPILKWTGAKQYSAFIWARGTNSSTTVENLTFDSIFTGSDGSQIPDALTASGSNFTARGNQFLNVGSAFNGNMGPQGILLQDNNAPSVTGIKNYFVWIEGRDFTVLGNKVANSTREHVLRVAGADRVMAAYNDFTNMNRVSVDQYDTSKGAMTIHKGNYVYIANNTLTNGPLSIGPLGANDGLNDKGARLNYVVAEANKLNTQTLVLHGAQHVAFRNNVSLLNADNAYTIDGYNGTYGRGVVDLKIYNNTGIDNDSVNGVFLKIQGSVNGIDLVNNLFVAPNLTVNDGMPVYVNDNDLNSFRVITNNVWSVAGSSKYTQGGVNYIWPTWSNSAGFQTPAEWNAWAQVGTDIFSTVTLSGYTPSSAAASAGTWVPGVFYDYYGKLRPSSGIAAGAVEV